MSDHSSSDDQKQCRRRVTVDVELDAAMALADMAGAGPGAAPASADQPRHAAQASAAASTMAAHEDEELASTRLSLELGKVGIQSSSPCSSSSIAGHPQQQALQVASTSAPAPAPGPGPGYGGRPRHMLTEAEKEAKRLRRVLANRESARQTILRRQAIRDELARKVADLSSQNETMKKEKDVVMQEYLSLKETNKQLKEQVAIRATKKASAAVTAVVEPMDTGSPGQQAEAVPAMATSTPPQPSFLYTAGPPAVPVPYVWGSWPPCGPGYEHGNPVAGAAPAPLCLPPCAWYYPVVADPRGSPPTSTYPQPFQDQPRAPEQTGSPGGGGTAEEDTDDDPCSLTLGIDVDRRCTSSRASGTGAGPAEPGQQPSLSDREKAATAAEARKRRKELTKMKQMHGGGRPVAGGGDHW